MDREGSATTHDLELMLIDVEAEAKRLPYPLLQEITNGFSYHNEIGSSPFAKVYKGSIGGNRWVALKRLRDPPLSEEREIECLMNVKHKNLVRFLGYCSDTPARFLCFEYLPECLGMYSRDPSCKLEWRKCYQIINGVCGGIHRLHQEDILHLDLNPRKILLDKDMVPKIADFHVSRRLDENQSKVYTENKAGTPGYIPPEACDSKHVLTKKFDLYSLGVIIMEILTGSKERRDVDKVIDSCIGRLAGSPTNAQLDQIKLCAQIAIECCDENPDSRPDTKHIIDRLEKVASTQETQESGKLLHVQPTALRFDLQLRKLTPCTLQLTNDTDEHMLFKLSTTESVDWSEHFMARLPLYGIVPPRSSYTLILTLWEWKAPRKRFCDMILQSCTAPYDHIWMLKDNIDLIYEEIFEVKTENAVNEVKLKALLSLKRQSNTSEPTEPRVRVVTIEKQWATLLSIDAHPTKPWIITGHDCGHVRIWNHEAQRPVDSFKVSRGPVYSVKFIARKQWFLSSSAEGLVHVYNYEAKMKKVMSFRAHDGAISLAVHPTLPYVLSSPCLGHHEMKLWDWDKAWECTQTFEREPFARGFVCQVAFDPKETNRFASASDHTVKVWSLDSPKPNYILPGHFNEVSFLEFFTRDDQQYLIFAASHDTTAKIWDMKKKEYVHNDKLQTLMSPVASVFSHPNLPILLAAGSSHYDTFRFWSPKDFRLEGVLDHRYGGYVRGIACLMESKRRFVIGQEAALTILDIDDGKYKDSRESNEPQLCADTKPADTSSEGKMEEGSVTASLGPMAPLLRQIYSLTGRTRAHIQGGSDDDIKRLKKHLEVLCRDLLEPEEISSTPKWWRKEVRELLYDTEDRLDDVILRRADDLSELIADVEDACERRKRLPLAPNMAITPYLGEASVSCITPQRTSPEMSMPISAQGGSAGSCMVGVEEPRNKLLEQLAFDDHNQKRLKVVPILGFPGVGTTTAARTLYHKYRGKFQCSAFVRVSRTPDMRSLLISILSQIKAPRLSGFPDVHDLIDGINKHLKSKRYFIIMDGLWTASVWDIISRAFPDGDYGSRIITTTQIYEVALACCSYYPDYIEMSPLNDDQSRRLFFTRIFGSEDCCPSDFKEVSYKTVKKCAGLPLAIVTVANLLSRGSNLALDKWKYMQDSLPSILRTNPTSEGMNDLSSDTFIESEGSQLARGPKNEKWKHTQDSLPSTFEWLKQVLSFICNNLPPHLKTCLLYLSMYPEGYLVRKHDLMRQWVAEGFVNAMEGRSAEEIAGGYFDELVSSGMVEPVDTKYCSGVLSCTVHHMVLDLIRHKSKEMNFVITVDYLQSRLALPDEVRRLSVQFGGAKSADIPENIVISKVRSLLFSGFFECVPSVEDYELLRVLILHIWADGDETSFDLTSISKLRQLRYLKIQCNIMVNLPDEIRWLEHLETLEVDARLSAIPSDIGLLKKLLHLLLPSEAILPRGLESLTSLLTLGCFDLTKNSLEDVIDLAELTNLQDLRLTCSKIPKLEALDRILERLNNLRSLALHGAGVSQSICHYGLSISTSPALLEKLELRPRTCTLSRLPEWIGKLSRLAILKIEVQNLSKSEIAILRGLTSLTALSLSVRTEHAELIFFNEGFPVLRYFKFVRTAPYTCFLEGAMPNVQTLKLAFNADKLKVRLSPGPSGFQYLTSLTEIFVKLLGGNADESNKADKERVLKEAVSNHPSSPILNIQWVD